MYEQQFPTRSHQRSPDELHRREGARRAACLLRRWVGVEEPGFVTKVGATLYRWAGLAFGAGLVRNVVEAYREIVCNYDPEGRVFLFGFSRGAYTVRVLAGVLENYGLLKRENQAMVETVIRKFSVLFPKPGSEDANDPAKRVSIATEPSLMPARSSNCIQWNAPCISWAFGTRFRLSAGPTIPRPSPTRPRCGMSEQSGTPLPWTNGAPNSAVTV